jgi:hypothetical protein
MDVDLNLLGVESASEPQDETAIDDAPPIVEESAPEVEAAPEPEAPAEVEPAPEFDADTLTPREKMLLERLEALTGEKLQLSRETPQLASNEPITPAEHNFLENLDLDEVLASPENFNRLLLSVYNRGLQEARNLAAENIMRNLPAVVSQYVTHHSQMAELVRNFYDANKDLVHVKRTVAQVANEVAANNPQLTTQQVFDQTAQRVREMLRIKKPAVPPANVQGRTPALAQGNRGRQSPTPQLIGLAKEIDDLINA